MKLRKNGGWSWRACIIAIGLSLASCNLLLSAEPSPVLTVLEDNAPDLLSVLTHPTGDPGEGHVDQASAFSGRHAIRIIPLQRFNNRIPGWAIPIRERPKAGEYRYLRFAWKAEGGTGIMLQLHDEK